MRTLNSTPMATVGNGTSGSFIMGLPRVQLMTTAQRRSLSTIEAIYAIAQGKDDDNGSKALAVYN